MPQYRWAFEVNATIFQGNEFTLTDGPDVAVRLIDDLAGGGGAGQVRVADAKVGTYSMNPRFSAGQNGGSVVTNATGALYTTDKTWHADFWYKPRPGLLTASANRPMVLGTEIGGGFWWYWDYDVANSRWNVGYWNGGTSTGAVAYTVGGGGLTPINQWCRFQIGPCTNLGAGRYDYPPVRLFYPGNTSETPSTTLAGGTGAYTSAAQNYGTSYAMFVGCNDNTASGVTGDGGLIDDLIVNTSAYPSRLDQFTPNKSGQQGF
jgi:hypothetical protein